MADINIDYGKTDKVISEMERALNQDMAAINSIYNTISHSLPESAGEEAEAFRKISEAENRLMTAMKETLSRIGRNIHTAADELKKIDTTYAAGMRITEE